MQAFPLNPKCLELYQVLPSYGGLDSVSGPFFWRLACRILAYRGSGLLILIPQRGSMKSRNNFPFRALHSETWMKTKQSFPRNT